MLEIIEKLLILQDRDRKLIRLRAEIEGSEPQRRHLQSKLAKAQADLEAVKLRSRHLESDRKKLELEVASKQQLIDKARTLQGSTKKNDEYAAYQHQIDTTQKEITELEDRQLDLMEKIEAAAREIGVAEALARSVKLEVEKQLADVAGREGNLKSELETVSADRSGLAAGIDDIVRSRYERILKSRGDSVIVGVGRSICGGCHMKLPTQVYVTAKGQQEIVNCPNCGRILYYSREMDG